MAAPQDAPLPPFFEMGDKMLIRVTAVDATTGATVSGVQISGVSFAVDPADAEGRAKDPLPGTAFAFGDVAV